MQTQDNVNIDKLIYSLNEIKVAKHTKKENTKNTIELLSNSYSQFKNSSEEMFSILKNLNDHIKKVENDRTNLKNILESQTDQTNSTQLTLPSSNLSESIKKFQFRESVLSKLFLKEDYETIYNIFLYFLIFLIGIFITGSFLNQNHLMKYDQIENLFTGFSHLIKSMVFNFIISEFFILFLLIVKKYKFTKNIITFTFVFLNSTYIYYTTQVETKNTTKMSVICKLIYFIETTRTVLKLISYFLEKVWLLTYQLQKGNLDDVIQGEILVVSDKGLKKVQNNICNKNTSAEIKNSNVTSDIKFKFFKITSMSIFSELKKFLYFYYSPTLIYRDEYPKLKLINSRSVLMNLVNTILGFCFNYFILDLMLIPFINGNLNYLKPENLMPTLINFVVFSILILFVSFFGICHAFCNLFADITGFADRNFYGDFWNARTPKEFIWKITSILHEFLDYYIGFIVRKYLGFGKFIIDWINLFLFSVILEYIIYFSLGFFFPVSTILIFFSGILSVLFDAFNISKHSISTFFTWMSVSLGCGVLVFISLIAHFIQNDHSLDHREICQYKFYTYFDGLC